MLKSYTSTSIHKVDDFIFGRSPLPVQLKSGLVIGGGEVYPELNFTLPNMVIDEDSMPEVRRQYAQMIQDAAKRATELSLPGWVVEFELLPDLTIHPQWGAEVTEILRDVLEEAMQQHGLKYGLRVTPNDIREFVRPPLMRSGEYVDNMFRSFELCANVGADMLAIESTGGKEIHDDAILNCDLPMSVFSMGILGSRDMAYLWDRITDICTNNSVIPSGDSACGFANTAMVLAENHYIPRVWAAVIRVMSVARSLVAYEHGAVGPGKDCAYEGVYIKAITGTPISLEGAEAACAHLSQIGNITKAVPDLWSNESVQNVKLLGAMAPTVSLEQLAYATRLMNVAISKGKQTSLTLRDLFVSSDSAHDPQAFVLRPDVVLKISDQIIKEKSAYARTRIAARAALDFLIKTAIKGDFVLSKIEMRWLDRLSKQAENLPENEDEFISGMVPRVDRDKVRLENYDLK